MHEANKDHPALSMLRLTTEHLRQLKFGRLIRPKIGPSQPPTKELVIWGIHAYCFPWLLQFGSLIGGIVTLFDTNNRAAVRILGRSSFELCAHSYYVKKHMKQNLGAGNLRAAWDFLLPIGTGSRYINEHHPEDTALFPSPPHIKKAINCFKEVMPEGSEDDYSYLSEYCHPNTMAFQQHYHWTSPSIIEFGDVVPFGAMGSIAASALQGLMATDELLGLGDEKEVRGIIRKLLIAIVEGEKNIPERAANP
jgi:hypothetical protein